MKSRRKEKRFLIRLLGPIFLLSFLPFMVFAGIPPKMNYQGYLTDSGGTPINGSITMQFSICDTPTGGSDLWTETQSVTVTNGIYSVNLGEVTPINLPFDVQYYLGVKVGIDPEMTPRRPLTNVPYAFRAGTVEKDQDTLGGLNCSSGQVAKWNGSAWVCANDEAGADGLTPSSTVVTLDGTSSAGTSTEYSRGDHKHGIGTGAITTTHILNETITNADISPTAAIDFSKLSGVASSVHDHDTRYYNKAYVDALEARIAVLESLLTNITRTGNNIYITGANLHIRSGTGTTYGAVNGFGNLIIGYNETRGSSDDRSGSHNLIVGSQNNFGSYGGIVVGFHNTISAMYASVSGGANNTASGKHSSVSGGNQNTAVDVYSSVTGGESNTASGNTSAVSGGGGNTASGQYSSVSGGDSNTASAIFSSVSGGAHNTASGNQSSVTGGESNTASGFYSWVSGGGTNKASGDYSSVSGGLQNTASGDSSSVTGGYQNTASGSISSISGGGHNKADGADSSISGGASNTASAIFSSVSGGYNRTVSGENDWRAGALFQEQ